MAAKSGIDMQRKLSYEQYEKYGANAIGRIHITVTATHNNIVGFHQVSSPDVSAATHIYAHTAILQMGEANSGYVSFSDENAVDAGASAQNAPRFGAGDTITLRFNDLAQLYFEANTGSQQVYILYFYYDDSVGIDVPKGVV